MKLVFKFQHRLQISHKQLLPGDNYEKVATIKSPFLQNITKETPIKTSPSGYLQMRLQDDTNFTNLKSCSFEIQKDLMLCLFLKCILKFNDFKQSSKRFYICIF